MEASTRAADREPAVRPKGIVERGRDDSLPFYGDVQVAARIGRRADRVTPDERLPLRFDSQGEELAGSKLEPFGSREPKRADVGRLVEHVQDRRGDEPRSRRGRRAVRPGNRRPRAFSGERRRQESLAREEPDYVRGDPEDQSSGRRQQPGRDRQGEGRKQEESRAPARRKTFSSAAERGRCGALRKTRGRPKTPARRSV